MQDDFLENIQLKNIRMPTLSLTYEIVATYFYLLKRNKKNFAQFYKMSKHILNIWNQHLLTVQNEGKGVKI